MSRLIKACFIIVVAGVKRDHLQSLADEDDAELIGVASSSGKASDAIDAPSKDMSLMQVALTVYSSSDSKAHAGTAGKGLNEDLDNTLAAAKGAALAMAQDVRSTANVAAEMAEETATGATAALSEASARLTEHHHSEVAPSPAKARTGGHHKHTAHALHHEPRQNASQAHRPVIRAVEKDVPPHVPPHPIAADHANHTHERTTERSGSAAGNLLEVLGDVFSFIKDSVCTLCVLLRVAILLTGCVLVHLLCRGLEFGVSTTGKATAAARAFCQKAMKAQVDKYVVKQSPGQLKSTPKSEPGRDQYVPHLHSEHPDLFEPSPFHQDRDRRRAVAGGE
eukprot:gb/GFBE01055534.1/.p1 GENE.gb/GFBE01055534.1/~~gb/GFBE01055534.1/.p1  ORF type:complete len:337 (+),score=76.59 gb/GFBE01055534.1/:1-1011(+)